MVKSAIMNVKHFICCKSGPKHKVSACVYTCRLSGWSTQFIAMHDTCIPPSAGLFYKACCCISFQLLYGEQHSTISRVCLLFAVVCFAC